MAGKHTGRFGWFVESWLSPRLHRRNQYVTVSLPSARELTELGVAPDRIAVVRNGLDEAPANTLTESRSASPRVAVLSRLVPHKQIEDALDAVAALRADIPEAAHGCGRGRLVAPTVVDYAAALGISDAVTFHGHIDDEGQTSSGATVLGSLMPSRKEGWGLGPSSRPPSTGCRPSATAAPAG